MFKTCSNTLITFNLSTCMSLNITNRYIMFVIYGAQPLSIAMSPVKHYSNMRATITLLPRPTNKCAMCFTWEMLPQRLHVLKWRLPAIPLLISQDLKTDYKRRIDNITLLIHSCLFTLRLLMCE